MRDFFGWILCLAMQQKIDMNEVLKYPLTPVLLCLTHVSGSVNIDLQLVTVPSSIDATIIDAAIVFCSCK